MMIARDTVAADQLVYAWPFPIGPEQIEVTCGNEEVVVMCPSWVIGDRLGPGRHRWRTPDPAKPTNAYFVLTGPVEAPFDMMTTFVIPTTQQPVRLRAQGSMLVRCIDPSLLISQFVGLPFDNINDGLMRSVGISVEKLLARTLVRRVLAAGSPIAVTDQGMLPSIIDECTAYNPTAGAVHGVVFVRFNQLLIQADDGGMGNGMWNPNQGWGQNGHDGHAAAQQQPYQTGGFVAPAYQTGAFATPEAYPAGFAAGTSPPAAPQPAPAPPPGPVSAPSVVVSSSSSSTVASGEIGVVSGEIGGNKPKKTATVPPGAAMAPTPTPVPPPSEPTPLAIGARVLVSSSDGLLHSSTIRQANGGYYEVEIGATGQTVWVPASQIIPE